MIHWGDYMVALVCRHINGSFAEGEGALVIHIGLPRNSFPYCS
jgi:hypothetical protein